MSGNDGLDIGTWPWQLNMHVSKARFLLGYHRVSMGGAVEEYAMGSSLVPELEKVQRKMRLIGC